MNIVWGQELFKKGYRWRIGNGLKVDASTDPWIPKEGSCKPILAHPKIQNFTVAQLLNFRGTWNEPLGKAFFMECVLKPLRISLLIL